MTFGGFRSLTANFTPTPNQFFDHVVGHYPGCVVTVVALLIRSTLGWADPVTGERRVEAELPLSAFLRPDLCESSARKGLAMAVAAGFIVQTARASNRDGARYALRWEDEGAQREAIERARRATQDPILADPARALLSGGPKNTPPEAGGRIPRGSECGGPKNTPPLNKVLKKSDSEKKKSPQNQTLNVGEARFDFVSSPDPEGGSAPARIRRQGEREEAPRPHWLEREAADLAAELHDRGSERRHRQLLSVCERHGLSHLPAEALRATRQRLARESKRGVVERPGAYYQRILIKLLEDHQVFVPIAGDEDSGDVRRLARVSLGLEPEAQ